MNISFLNGILKLRNLRECNKLSEVSGKNTIPLPVIGKDTKRIVLYKDCNLLHSSLN